MLFFSSCLYYICIKLIFAYIYVYIIADYIFRENPRLVELLFEIRKKKKKKPIRNNLRKKRIINKMNINLGKIENRVERHDEFFWL